MAHHTDKRNATARVGKALRDHGWTLYGWKDDKSDFMTDYYDPESWDGVATKNGFVLCVDVSSYRANDSGKAEHEHVTTDIGDCPECHGTGMDDSHWTLAKARQNPAEFNQYRLQREHGATGEVVEGKLGPDSIGFKMSDENGVTTEIHDIMGAVVSPLHFRDDGSLKCHHCGGVGRLNRGDWQPNGVVWPTFQANPKNCSWHIEQAGEIVAKGKGVFNCASHESHDEQAEAALAKLVARIEKVVSPKPHRTAPKQSTPKGERQNMTIRDRCVAACETAGLIELPHTRKYRVFELPNGNYVYLGKSGAVRVGKNVTKSHSLCFHLDDLKEAPEVLKRHIDAAKSKMAGHPAPEPSAKKPRLQAPPSPPPGPTTSVSEGDAITWQYHKATMTGTVEGIMTNGMLKVRREDGGLALVQREKVVGQSPPPPAPPPAGEGRKNEADNETGHAPPQLEALPPSPAGGRDGDGGELDGHATEYAETVRTEDPKLLAVLAEHSRLTPSGDPEWLASALKAQWRVGLLDKHGLLGTEGGMMTNRCRKLIDTIHSVPIGENVALTPADAKPVTLPERYDPTDIGQKGSATRTAAALMSCHDVSRHILGGVHFEANRIEATNMRAMIQIPGTTGKDDVVLANDDTELDGQFPDTDSVIPSQGSATLACTIDVAAEAQRVRGMHPSPMRAKEKLFTFVRFDLSQEHEIYLDIERYREVIEAAVLLGLPKLDLHASSSKAAALFLEPDAEHPVQIVAMPIANCDDTHYYLANAPARGHDDHRVPSSETPVTDFKEAKTAVDHTKQALDPQQLSFEELCAKAFGN